MLHVLCLGKCSSWYNKTFVDFSSGLYSFHNRRGKSKKFIKLHQKSHYINSTQWFTARKTISVGQIALIWRRDVAHSGNGFELMLAMWLLYRNLLRYNGLVTSRRTHRVCMRTKNRKGWAFSHLMLRSVVSHRIIHIRFHRTQKIENNLRPCSQYVRSLPSTSP